MLPDLGGFEFALATRYRIVSLIGRGAMATVYRATDLKMRRDVALKVLHPMLTNEIGIGRFESEIRIAGNLQHPNIVTLHDCGEIDGRLYYVMALGGESLRARLRRDGRIPIDQALKILHEIAAGLQHAHDHQVVHRDVKPENIIFVDDRALITDFGLARVINDSGSPRLTESGFVVGTPPYLSPEQASAEKRIGPAADQYALACVLFEMLTGEPPFDGPTAVAIAMRHANDPPPLLEVLLPGSAPRLTLAVTRALGKRSEERFRSVADFAAAATVGNDAGVTAPPGPSSLLDSLKARFSASGGRDGSR